ncbi:MAG: protein kinase [Planctomycetota bacterium]
MSDPALERIVAEFESAFLSGEQLDIAELVDSLPEGVSRQAVLSELANTELELRLRRGEPARVEQYVATYPELDVPELVIELMRTEFKIRRHLETGLRFDEFVVRFPGSYDMLVADLGDESTFAPDGSRNGTRLDSTALSTGTHSDEVSRFRKTRLYDEGGLGNVWLAHDVEFDRTVALKEIKAKYASSRDFRFRFNREARITASLEHPGIVPVYGMGRLQNGTPYYAMKLVKGQSLQKTITDFHDAENKPESSSRFRQLVRHFLSACDAVHYAHSRGVIHRDLKPANIMIGDYGETFVVDWGLAKLISGNEPADDGDRIQSGPSAETENNDLECNVYDSGLEVLSDGALNTPASAADFSETLDGQTVGSPAFMSPEQAEGNWDELSPASDVYSLGATLYSLITNERNPNSLLKLRDSKAESLASDASSQFRSKVDRSLQGLVSICIKAMASMPEHRYESAAQLAAEVERFLANEKVSAHRESVGERLTRFTRRYEGIVRTALAGLAVIATVSVVSAVLFLGQRNRAIASDLRSQELLRGRNIATETTMLVASGSGTCNAEAANSIDGAVQFIGQMIKQVDRSQRPFLWSVIAANHLGRGDAGLAVEKYRLAADGMAEFYPDDLYLVIENDLGLSKALLTSGRHDEAYALIDRTMATVENNDQFSRQEFAARMLLTSLHLSHDDVESAEQQVDLALEIADEVYSQEHHHRFAALLLKAQVNAATGDTQAAHDEVEQVLNDLERLGLYESVTGINARVLRGALLADASVVTTDAGGRGNDALTELEAARSLAEFMLGPSHPTTVDTVRELANFHARNGGYVTAVELLEQASDVIETFAAPYEPKRLENSMMLANTCLQLSGRPEGRMRRVQLLSRAKEILETSLAAANARLQSLADREPEQSDDADPVANGYDTRLYRSLLAKLHLGAGRLHGRSGDWAAAIRDLESAITHAASVDDVEVIQLARDNLALSKLSVGDFAEAAELFADQLQRAEDSREPDEGIGPVGELAAQQYALAVELGGDLIHALELYQDWREDENRFSSRARKTFLSREQAILLATGDLATFERQIEQHRRAIDEADTRGPGKLLDEYYFNLNLVEFHLLRNDAASARAALNEIPQNGFFGARGARINAVRKFLDGLITATENQGDIDKVTEAFVIMEEAWPEIDEANKHPMVGPNYRSWTARHLNLLNDLLENLDAADQGEWTSRLEALVD